MGIDMKRYPHTVTILREGLHQVKVAIRVNLPWHVYDALLDDAHRNKIKAGRQVGRVLCRYYRQQLAALEASTSEDR